MPCLAIWYSIGYPIILYRGYTEGNLYEIGVVTCTSVVTHLIFAWPFLTAFVASDLQVASFLYYQEQMNVLVEPDVHDIFARIPGFGFIQTFYTQDTRCGNPCFKNTIDVFVNITLLQGFANLLDVLNAVICMRGLI